MPNWASRISICSFVKNRIRAWRLKLNSPITHSANQNKGCRRFCRSKWVAASSAVIICYQVTKLSQSSCRISRWN
jgi:hypothetical protein